MPSKEKFYCVSCGDIVKVDAQNIIGVVEFRNNRPALKAECAKCETTVYRIISKEDKNPMTDKYGTCKK